MKDRNEQFNVWAAQGEISKIEQAIDEADGDYHEAEHLVFDILGIEPMNKALIDRALQKFMDSHDDCEGNPEHGYWVHSLSHFTDNLWHLRLTDWLKKFYKVAFDGAIKFRDSNCSSRLVGSFEAYALWSDDPADFHLVLKNMAWMDWEYYGSAKERIKKGPFKSEADFLESRLANDEYVMGGRVYNIPWEGGFVSDKAVADVLKLRELGAEAARVAKIADRIRVTLGEALVKLAELKPTLKEKFQKDAAEKQIAKTKEALNKLS